MTTVWMRAAMDVLGVIVLTGCAAIAALFWQRRMRHAWIGCYALGLLVIALIGLSYWFRHLQFIAPFSWAVSGRREFVLCAPAAALVFTPMLGRLRTRRERGAIVVFCCLICGRFSLLPFVGPALSYGQLAACTTSINGQGVCLQTLDYTCGPAAAVTALRHFGIDGDEGEIGIASGASAMWGTLPDVLCETLQTRLRPHGLRAQYRAFDSVADLALVRGCVIAVVKFALMVDHYVTVVGVSPEFVTVADPARGREDLTHEEFRRRWRRVGIVVEPAPSSRIRTAAAEVQTYSPLISQPLTSSP